MLPAHPIPVAQYGIGPIGAEITRLILSKPWLKLVAAVDIDPEKVGRDVGDVVGLGRQIGLAVTRELSARPLVVCHSTSSRLRDVESQLIDLLGRGCHVVSTTEELSFPLDVDARERLQRTARSLNVTLLGTGVNPGFIMDKLPLTVTAVCQEVRSIEVFRTVDASRRREPLQRKVGAGMNVDEFRQAVAKGRIRHIGLRESLMMIANGLNVEFETISDETIEPVVADGPVTTDFLTVEKGEVAGVHQTIFGRKNGAIDVLLDLKMYVGAPEPADRIEVRGVPDLSVEVRGGVHGDRATAAMAVNAIPRVVVARPGVLTMDDIPISYR